MKALKYFVISLLLVIGAAACESNDNPESLPDSGGGINNPSAMMSAPKGDYFVAVDDMPEPIGGVAAIQQRVHYPELAKKAGIQGRVYVKAFIGTDGKVEGATIIKGIHEALNQAALEAVKATEFRPGYQNGKAVKVQVSIPILFKLADTARGK